MKLTWWEADELVETLRNYPYLWTEGDGLWVRWNNPGQDTMDFSLQILTNPTEARFRTCTLVITPVNLEHAEQFMEGFCRRHTSYGLRMETEEILTKEFGVVENAGLQAIVLSYLHHVGSVLHPGAEKAYDTIPPEHFSFIDANQPLAQFSFRLAGRDREAHLRLFYSRNNYLLRVNMWLPEHDGDDEVELRGFIHPQCEVSGIHQRLFGWSDSNETRVHGGGGGTSTSPEPGHTDRGETERGEELPELPPAVRVGEGGEPDTGQTPLAPGVRECNPQVPPGEGEGGRPREEHGGGDDPAVQGHPEEHHPV